MMQRGTVVIQGIKPKRSLIRFVQKQVEKWIGAPELSAPQRYSVLIDRYRDHRVECSIVVKSQDREWHIQEWGNSIPDALSRGLRHLRSLYQNVPMPPQPRFI